MPGQSPFAASSRYYTQYMREYRGVLVADAHAAGVAAEYAAARQRAVVVDRSDRGLIVATGGDRKAWLHNLVTNAVSTLDDRCGNYAFAIDVKGRVLFDLNVLALPDALWLDIDATWVPPALAHLDRYLITEDVQLRDATGDYARLGCAGPEAARIAASLGVSNLSAMAALSSVPLDDGSLLVRHDFAGGPGLDLIVPRERAVAWWDRLAADDNAHAGDAADPKVTAAGLAAIDAMRIEAGIPWSGRDIDDRTLPPETGQIERGISYHKGCYLGQEVIERMRSHNVLARRLVRLRCDAAPDELELPVPLLQGEAEVGRVTSLVRHPTGSYWVGLGYLKTSVTDASGLTAGEPAFAVEVA